MSDWPLCECGCGDPVKAHGRTGKPNRYASKRCYERTYTQRNPGRRVAISRYHYQKRKAEDHEALKAATREAKRRALATEEGRKRQAARTRKWMAKVNADPERRAQYLAKRRAWGTKHRQQLKHEDPEAYAQLRQREREANRRHRTNPQNKARFAESRRISAALAREKQGRPFRSRNSQAKYHIDDRIPRLPVAPLVAWIEAKIKRNDRPDGLGHLADKRLDAEACHELGIEPRSFYAWKSGERDTAQFNVVDRIITNGGVNWWDIYDPDEFPEEYEKARAVFEPKELAA